MIDEETLANVGAGMDVDFGLRMGDFSDDASQEWRVEAIELMRQAMAHDRCDPGKAEDHLIDALRRRVVGKGRAHVLVEGGPYAGQRGGELRDDVMRRPAAEVRGLSPVLSIKREREVDLSFQSRQSFYKRVRHKRVCVLCIQTWRSEMTRIKGRQQTIHDLLDRLARWQAWRRVAIPAELRGGPQLT